MSLLVVCSCRCRLGFVSLSARLRVDIGLTRIATGSANRDIGLTRIATGSAHRDIGLTRIATGSANRDIGLTRIALSCHYRFGQSCRCRFG